MLNVSTQRSKLSFIYMLFASALLAGCLPTNEPLTIGDNAAKKSFGGFSGISDARTEGAGKVKLFWSPSNDPEVVAYNIYDTSNFFTPVLIRSVPVPANNITITGLDPHKLYSFRVRAANARMIEDSNVKEVKAIPFGGATSAEVITSTLVKINYNDASNYDSVQVLCRINGSTEYELLKEEFNVSSTSTNVGGLTPGNSYVCRVAAVLNGFVDNNSKTVSFTPIGQATRIAFRTQPGSANAGANFSPQPVIEILDANDNVVSAGPDSNAIISLSLAGNSSGSIRGSVSIAANKGVATFTDLNIQEAGLKVLKATKSDTSTQPNGSGPLTVDSASFTITAGNVSPTMSSISVSPAEGLTAPLIANGIHQYNVKIALADMFGNPIIGTRPTFATTNSADTITQPSVNTNAQGETSGSISTPVAGLRTLSIAQPSGLSSVTVPVTFVHGPATKLGFKVQPQNSPAGEGLMNPPIEVEILDQSGNRVTTGPSATANVSLSLVASSVPLTGTTTVQAVGGVATFAGLGIGTTGTGYRLAASSPGLTLIQSSTFNITAGSPVKIGLTAPTSIKSGVCNNPGTAIMIRLLDGGNNPANAPFNMTVNLTGLGGTQLFTTCGGTAAANSITFTSGTNSRTLYMRNNKAENLTITATDAASYLQSASVPLAVTPAQVELTGPGAVLSGRCSAAFSAQVKGADGTNGVATNNTTFNITGLSPDVALYSNDTCTGLPLASSVTIPAGSGSVQFYLKDNKAETLSLSIEDPAQNISTVSAPLLVQVLPSKIHFVGPSSSVAGQCSTAFTVQLRDANDNIATTPNNLSLSINGLSGTTGQFRGSCGGSSLNTTVVVSANTSQSTMVYFNNRAQVSNIKIQDLNANLAMRLDESQTITISVSPSSFNLAKPPGTGASTNTCAGPFTLTARDAEGNVTAAVNPITANLTGKGRSGDFFSDSSCSSAINSLSFAPGVSSRQFWFRGLYPESLTLVASDAAAVLTNANTTWNITAAKGWLGSSSNGMRFFEQGLYPMSAREDGVRGTIAMAFNATKDQLYVVDRIAHRVLKFNYSSSGSGNSFIGWVGRADTSGGFGLAGSNVPDNPLLNAQCASTGNLAVTPGWCFGGQSAAADGWSAAQGGMNNPMSIAVGGGWIYVANRDTHVVTRYREDTGEFGGWIGRINNAHRPTGPGYPDLTNTCNSIPDWGITPGWCRGGHPAASDRWSPGFHNPVLVGYAPTNGGQGAATLIVADHHSVKRFNAETGEYLGWIGIVENTPLGPGMGLANDCASRGNNQSTPGWCMGGRGQARQPWEVTGGIHWPTGLYIDDANDRFYVVDNEGSGWISEFVISTGAFVKHLRSGTTGGVTGLISPRNLVFDNGFFYVADSSRIIKLMPNGTNPAVVTGWIGMVDNNLSMGGAPGCASLQPNETTPGWCTGGTAKAGLDERSFTEANSIVIDGDGKFLVGAERVPGIKRFILSSGVYDGQLVEASNSPTIWSANATKRADREGWGDRDMYNPFGVHVDGDFLYVAEYGGGRVKKINKLTGELVGWIGGLLSRPTEGGASCLSANPRSVSPTWCLGAWPLPQMFWWWGWDGFTNNHINAYIGGTVDGLMARPIDITSDANWLYVLDELRAAIYRFRKDNGAYGGWIGWIERAPNGGFDSSGSPSSNGCQGAANFTPGWCSGGTPRHVHHDGNGAMAFPHSITYAAGRLYVTMRNHANNSPSSQINAYMADTGSFVGWTGRIAITPSSGSGGNCSGAPNTHTNGFCKGGRSLRIGWNWGENAGGGLSEGTNLGIDSDGTYLYVSGGNNSRIDRFTLEGVYVDSAQIRWDQYNNQWTNNPTSWIWNGYRAHHLWVDASHVYAIMNEDNERAVVVKMNKTTGNIVGWQGAIRSGSNPTSPAACQGASGVTPTWCQGGDAFRGYTLGSAFTPRGISGDDHFIYISDFDTNRVTRIPK